jgi:hypothetical protein
MVSFSGGFYQNALRSLNTHPVEDTDRVMFRQFSAITYTAGHLRNILNRGADKSLARLETKQATATEDFDVHISSL